MSAGLSAIDLENIKHIEKYKTSMESEIEEAMLKLTQAVTSVDDTLASIISKHEIKYQNKYAEFVLEKTMRLNELVAKLNEKSSNRTLKDVKIGELQTLIQKLQREAALAEGMNEERSDDLRLMRQRLDQVQTDRKFLYMHARDEKKKSRGLEKRVKELESELEELRGKMRQMEEQEREVNLRILKEMTLGGHSESAAE
jgi:hypothetical protein